MTFLAISRALFNKLLVSGSKKFKGEKKMAINQYTPGTLEYKLKQKAMEVQTRGYTDVETVKQAKELIRFAYNREGIPLRYTQLGAIIRVLPA
jgi:hypothetical protein